MSELTSWVIVWLADMHLLAFALLAAALGVMLALRQPARRMAIAKATLAGLTALAVLCALPGWSLVHLKADDAPGGNTSPSVAAPQLTADELAMAFPAGDAAPTSVESPRAPNDASGSTTEDVAAAIPWPMALLAAHGVGSALVVAWLACGAVLARRTRQAARQAPAELTRALRTVVGDAPLPELLVSVAVASPVALGWRRPAIILPSRGGDLVPILAHEWAHIANSDLRTLAVSRWLLVLLWPQPLYWSLRRTIRFDQETLADAAAAERAGKVDYAELLMGWARAAGRSRVPRLAGAVGLWESPSQLKRRIAALLDEKLTVLRQCSRRWMVATLACSLIAAGLLSLVTLQGKEASAADSRPATADGSESGDSQRTDGRSPRPAVSQDFVQKRKNELVRQLRKEPNTVSGYCVDENGEPFANGEIGIYAHDDGPRLVAQAKSNADGFFQMSDVVDVAQAFPDGIPEDLKASMSLVIVGRAPGRAALVDAIPSASVAQSGDLRIFELRPAVTLSGVVIDPAGRPVEGAVASTMGFAELGIHTDRTDGEGRFAITDLHKFGVAERRLESEINDKFSEDHVLTIAHPDFATQEVVYPKAPIEVHVQLAFADARSSEDFDASEASEPAAASREAPAWAQPEPNVVKGRVVDEAGQAIAGADVALFLADGWSESTKPRQLATQNTAEDGEFRFENVIDVAKEFPKGLPDNQFPEQPTKIVGVLAQSPGRAPKWGNTLASFAAGRGHVDQLALPQAQTLRGRVTDEAGEPVEGAEVRVGRGQFPGTTINVGRTNARGEYEVADLAPHDAVELKRQQDVLRAQESHGDVHYPAPYASEMPLLVRHPDFATKRVDVRNIPGEQAVQLAPGATIEGVALLHDREGEPAPAANVTIQITRELPQPKIGEPLDLFAYQTTRVQTDAEGRYRFPSLPVGTYTIYAKAPGWTTQGLQGVAGKASQTTTAPELVLTRGGTVRMRLVDADSGKPLALPDGTRGWVNPQLRPLQPMGILPLDPNVMTFRDSAAEFPLAAGKYAFFVHIPGETPQGSFWQSTPAATEAVRAVVEGEALAVDVPMRKQETPTMATGTYTLVGPPIDGDAEAEEEDAAGIPIDAIVPATLPADAQP